MMNNSLQDQELGAWLGRRSTIQDEITAFPVKGLAATLDRDDVPNQPGSPVPQLWHWLYFLPAHRPRELRRDGHAHGGEFMPPIALPRRMWAGSKFIWNIDNPLRVGDKATRISRIDSITPKAGKSGELVFVKVIHEFHNDAGLSFTNEHLSAFRGAAQSGNATSVAIAAATNAAWHRVLVPDAVLLFRYSALTFNSHRIHYDWPYARDEEGYPAPLVHGPLVATLLLDLLHRSVPGAAVRTLEFKAVRPSFVGRPLHLRGGPEGDVIRLWAANDDGELTMKASATVQT